MSVLWLLIVLSPWVRSHQLRKCCLQGSSVYAGQQVHCQPSSHVWMYAQFSYGLPEVCQRKEIKDYRLADQGSTASCIDNLNGTETIVAVQCEADEKNFTVPNVHYLRKCCPLKRVYDSILQSCWGAQADSSPTAFLNVLMYNAAGVIDIKHGVPECAAHQVVVDHLVTSDKVHRDQTASISFKDGDRTYVMNPDEVCVDRTERQDVLIVRTCEDFSIACMENTCIRKCCPEDESYSESKSCTPTQKNIRSLPEYEVTAFGLVASEARTPAYWYGLDCEKYIENPVSEYILGLDGSLYNEAEGVWTGMGEFCIENVEFSPFNGSFVFTCFLDSEFEPYIQPWATLGMLVSCVFLFLTLLVYAILPRLSNLHGKTLMCHVFCLLSAYASLSTVQLITDHLLARVCTVLGQQLQCQPSSHVWINAQFIPGLPEVCQRKEIKDYRLADQGSTASCIDNLNGTDTIVAIKCEADEKNFTVPNVHYLRKCCPLKRVYDSILQSCWGAQADSSPTAFLNVLMYNAAGVIDINHGVPNCAAHQVVVDHLVSIGDIHRDPAASISFKDGKQTYVMNPDELCVDRTENSSVVIVRTCEEPNNACSRNTCIRKCCPEDQSYSFSKSCKVTNNSIGSLTVYNTTDNRTNKSERRTLALWYGLKCEKYKDNLTTENILAFDGSVYIKEEKKWIGMGNFCIERVEMEKEKGVFVFICFPPDDTEPNIHPWTTLAMLASALFLLLTFIVYAILPSLKNLHGKTLMCHMLCLLTAYASLVTVQLITNHLLDRVCTVLGYITFFSFLSAFFWLNIISFDIWWTFGSMRPMVNRKRRELRRFLLYSAYAWINPTIIVVLAGIADHVDILPANLRPGIGAESCWFKNVSNGLFLFFTAPIGILLTVNLIFFILTARHCAKVKSDLDKVGHTPIADNKFKSDRSRFVMNCKLFVAMGINWGLEFVSAVFIRSSFLPTEMWYLTDMANACQGLVIFCIFVMKRRVLAELRRRLEELLCCVRPPPRQPSVSTLFSGNASEVGVHPMKKSVSETRLSPLPQLRHKSALKSQPKSKSANRLLV